MPEENQNDRGETDRGKEMRDRQNALGPQPVPQEQFGEEGTYMEPNSAQIPWKNVPYDPADSRPNPNSEIEGQSEELTGKKPTMDRFGNPIEEVPAPRGEPQNVAAGIAYNPPTTEELAEQDRQRRGQTRRDDRQEQRQQPDAQIPEPVPGAAAMSTPAEDVQALRRAVIDVLHTAPFDDMAWQEIQAALQLVMHDVRVVFGSVYAEFNAAPPPFPLEPEEPAA